MPKIWYAVNATLPSGTVADEYLRWLSDGHLAAVVAGGAESAAAVRLDRFAGDGLPEAARQVQAQYVFPSRDGFERYVRDHAPGLRAEGLRLFGPERGIRMERRIGEIV